MDFESNTIVKALRVVGGNIIALVMLTFIALSIVEYAKSGEVDIFVVFVIVGVLFAAEIIIDVRSVLSVRFRESYEGLLTRRPALALFEIIVLVFSLPVCAAGAFLALVPLLGYGACFVLDTTPDRLGSAAGIIIVGVPLILTIVGLLDIMLMIGRKGRLFKEARSEKRKQTSE